MIAQTIIYRILFGKPYKGKLKVGDRIYSKYFGKDLIITKIYSDKTWYFYIEHPNYNMLREFDQGEELKARTKLSELEKQIKI